MLDVSDYELSWPPDLFVAEARRILARPRLSHESIDLLLREAFRDENVAEDLDSLAESVTWGSDLSSFSERDVLEELVAAADQLRRSSGPRPYWPQRQGRQESAEYLDAPRLRRAFANLIDELEGQGYLDQIWPDPLCGRTPTES